ncbi:MAG: hypothetical protein ACXWID_01605 [Pyrinomonadaceae bacterium]
MNKEINKDLPLFLGYLQRRMDFIAQVATSAPSWCMVTGFDELIEEFNNRYCLVKNIIRSHQTITDGPDFEPLFEKKYESTTMPTADIPHGQVGIQAFYTILENIVRNTAKYGNPQELKAIKSRAGDGKLKFTVSVKEKWKSPHPNWVDNFYQVNIREHITTASSPAAESGVVVSLQKYLAEELTHPVTGIVNARYWGMKEIKICAAYLRMVKQDEIDETFEEWATGADEHNPPIITVSLEDQRRVDGDVMGHLVYTIYLLRPKKALVVVRAESDPLPDSLKMPPKEFRNACRRAGIEFSTLDDFIDQIRSGLSPRHEFLILPPPIEPYEWRWLSEKLNFLPPRVLLRDCDERQVPATWQHLSRSIAFIKGLSTESPAALMSEVTDSWLNRWWRDFKIAVRWTRSASTVADVKIPGGDSGRDYVSAESGHLLVFDHLPRPDTTPLFDQAAFHEPFDGTSALGNLLLLQSTPGDEATRDVSADQSRTRTAETSYDQSRFRLRETAGLSVAIIDERLWLEKDGLATGLTKYTAAFKTREEVWKKRRVFLANTGKAFEDFEAFVEKLKPPDRDLFDFVIIHQGIIDTARDKLEKMVVSTDRLRQNRFDKAMNQLREKARWLVVDSGRGQPEHALAWNLRWVEYSNLAECVIHNAGDKFKLAELLWRLRASADNGTK